jgi:hypothetical protein
MHDQHPHRDAAVPSPDLDPAAVVAVHLRAFRGDDAAATAFRFATPALRRRLGSAPELAAILHSRLYRPLLDFERAATTPVEVEGETASQEVTVAAADGHESVYRFRLVRERADDGPDGVVGTAPADTDADPDCWLVRSVDRIA